VSQFEIRPESVVKAIAASEWEAEDHYPNRPLYSAQLERGLGGDNRRWRRRLAAVWTKGPGPLTNGWLALLSGVSAFPAKGLVLEKIRGGHGLMVMFGVPLLLCFSSRGEWLWRPEVDWTAISSKDSN
jgi:hypothetical protein